MTKKNILNFEVLDTWVEYVETFGPRALLLSKVIKMGYSCDEAVRIFKKAIDTNKAPHFDTKHTKVVF